jgi:hypothetical protein
VFYEDSLTTSYDNCLGGEKIVKKISLAIDLYGCLPNPVQENFTFVNTFSSHSAKRQLSTKAVVTKLIGFF